MIEKYKNQLEINLHNLSNAVLLGRKKLAYDSISNLRVLLGLENPPKNITSVDILHLICNAFDINTDEIKIRGKRRYVYPRYVYMYVLYYHFNKGIEVIARELNCDHSTVTYGKSQIENWLNYDVNLRKLIMPILDRLKEKKEA